MKHLKGSLLLILLVIISCAFFKGDVKAGNGDFFKEYSGEYCGYEEYIFWLKYECRLTVYMKYDEAEESDMPMAMTVTISDEDEYAEFDEFLNFTGEYQKTITLFPGKYTLGIEGNGAYYVSLSGEYYPELSSEDITLEEGKTKTLKVNGTSSKVKWSSSNKSIATVSSKGVVKAKKAGKATITAKCGGRSLKCKVTVKKKPVSYNVIAKKMKTFAKKNKNYKFENIDIGNKCRLYGYQGTATSSDSILYSEGYIMEIITYPYIELVKKSNNKSEIRLKFYGEMFVVSLSFNPSLYCDKINTSTSNRKMSFPMKQTYGKNYFDYSKQLYVGKMKGYSIISSSSKRELSNLKKLKTMLGQNSFRINVVSTKNFSMWGGVGVPTAVRKNWMKLLKEYDVLLKKY